MDIKKGTTLLFFYDIFKDLSTSIQITLDYNELYPKYSVSCKKSLWFLSFFIGPEIIHQTWKYFLKYILCPYINDQIDYIIMLL